MEVVPVIATAAVLLAAVREGTAQSRRTVRRPTAGEASVTLSVLPARTARVVVDGDEFAPRRHGLVEHAVREAFVFSTVDVVEVRRRDGSLIERRHRTDRGSRRAVPGRSGGR